MNKVDFVAYLNIGIEVEEWKEGINFVRRLVRLVGMVLEGDGNVDGNNDDGDFGVEDCE